MQLRSASRHVWARALLVTSLYLVLTVGIFVGGASIGEHGPEWIPHLMFSAIGCITIVCLVIGPAWVFQPRTRGNGAAPGGVRAAPSPHV